MGAWFGILALLVQLVVSVLPVQSLAATAGSGGDAVHICSTHLATPAGKDTPQSPHRHAQCPLCVAAGLGADLLPPPLGNFIGTARLRPVALPPIRFIGPVAAAHYTPQQPRGPPALL